ncbi:hypothetical protein SAICODRAFT_198614 [Saitoella complicata NRRL Y-17804]|uniref:uncharacterized protein n=1 Tax=Saitoella complicata (strain BCRC 22490 / CBS 7301 / JCM 7358 / NBRC 10748 / NRRL Y-17804) TaxID=698492 RepID=UPI00086714D8|nr:uncharacterized protein SAICODRAFT_198614 [Saitoella complicata NRRL Y-17804]ODQ55032.1 hypothetical protein SAICODRAFT_198614 [Saitoella complicata NRRL Y-17804]
MPSNVATVTATTAATVPSASETSCGSSASTVDGDGGDLLATERSTATSVGSSTTFDRSTTKTTGTNGLTSSSAGAAAAEDRTGAGTDFNSVSSSVTRVNGGLAASSPGLASAEGTAQALTSSVATTSVSTVAAVPENSDKSGDGGAGMIATTDMSGSSASSGIPTASRCTSATAGCSTGQTMAVWTGAALSVKSQLSIVIGAVLIGSMMVI